MLTTLVSLDKVYVYFDVDEATFLRYQQQGRHDARLPVKVGPWAKTAPRIRVWWISPITS